jgi:acetyl-CoA acetyltransferase
VTPLIASDLRGGSIISGIGFTPYSKNSGRTVLGLALEACMGAISDSGVPVGEVDGVVTFGLHDSPPAIAVATGLGLPRLRHFATYLGGGDLCVSLIGDAAKAVMLGEADHVLVYRALNGRSGKRTGGSGSDTDAVIGRDDAQFTYPQGWMTFPQYNAMCARRHMLKYGTTTEDFGRVAVQMRANAALNERAMYRDPITLEDHQNSRMIADPFRLLDCCLETDGACAFLVSRAEHSKYVASPPVSILAWANGGGPKPGYGFDGFYTYEEGADLYSEYIAPELWRRAGLGPQDVDVASIYDCFTFSVLSQLEGFGFCKRGEGAGFVLDGNIAPDGQVGVNLNGGMLSEAYVPGFNGLIEVVQQLRGSAGIRQRPSAEIGLATGFGTTTGSGLVLSAAS